MIGTRTRGARWAAFGRWMGSTLAAALLFGLSPAVAETIAIRAGRVITDASAAPLGPSTIIVRDGRIDAIEEAAAPVPADARIVDLAGLTVMPGLIDTHVHLLHGPGTQWIRLRNTNEYGVAIGLVTAKRLVDAGFTTVRDLGPEAIISQAVRDAIAAGLHPGPRVIAAAMITIDGGHGQLLGYTPDVMDALSLGIRCAGPDACAAAVRRAARDGADAIKVMVTGGSLGRSRGLGQHFSDAELAAIVETAHDLGMRVSAHASGAGGVEAAARAGVDSIEHGTFGQEPAARLMREHGVMLAPTLITLNTLKENVGKGVYSPEVEAKNLQVVAVMGRMMAAARKEGVRIVFGSDSGVYEHGRNAEEALFMARMGNMTPREVLAAGTTTAAELLDLEQETGTLEVGKAADIIAVEGDPLQDLTALQRVRFVMARGHIVRGGEGE